MASNHMDTLQLLQLYCYTFDELQKYISEHGIDPNHPAVITRQNELFSNELITDADVHRLLMYCCHTTEDLDNLICDQGFEHNDRSIIARRRELEVCCHRTIMHSFDMYIASVHCNTIKSLLPGVVSSCILPMSILEGCTVEPLCTCCRL